MAFSLSVTYTFVAGTTIVAAEHNQNMTDVENWCSINKFAGTSFPASPSEGQWFYRTDENTVYWHDGTDWTSSKAVLDTLTVSTITIPTGGGTLSTTSNGDFTVSPNGTGRFITKNKATNTVVKTTTCTLTVAEAGQVEVTASSAWTCTLPAVKKGLIYVFKKTDNNTNAITIAADSGEYIDGVSSKADVLTVQYAAYAVVGNDAEDGWNGYGG